MARILWLFLFLLVMVPKQAFAYLDPGSGSYLFQLLLAGLLALSFTLKSFWKRLALFFQDLFRRRRS